jgi:hypothetical protein
MLQMSNSPPFSPPFFKNPKNLFRNRQGRRRNEQGISWNLTGRLGLVGDDATDEMGCRGAERRHQVIQLLLLFL